MRTALSLLFCLASGSQLIACGGQSKDIAASCDDRNQPYEAATEHAKIKAPEGLDDLDRMKELPLPEAAPRPDRPADAPCLELPPGVTGRSSRRSSQQEQPDEGPPRD